MDLKVKFHVRKFGHRYITDIIETIFVEDDSVGDEIHDQINYHYRRWIDNEQIVETHGYTII